MFFYKILVLEGSLQGLCHTSLFLFLPDCLPSSLSPSQPSLPVCLSVCLSVGLFLHLPSCPSVSLPVCLPVCLQAAHQTGCDYGVSSSVTLSNGCAKFCNSTTQVGVCVCVCVCVSTLYTCKRFPGHRGDGVRQRLGPGLNNDE